MSKHLTIGEIADYCRVPYSTVIKWLKTGKLKSFPGTEECSQVSRSDFIEFLHTYKLPVAYELYENKRKRILIVDDDTSIVEFLRDILSEIESLEIETAYNGREAGNKIAEFKPHIIILDLWMPGINGFEICRHLKYNPATSAIKILAITGYPCPQAIRKITNTGADYLMEKPIDTEKLRKVIVQLLEEGKKSNLKINK